MSNILATQASGTSGHNNNLNPGCDESLSKLQSILFHMKMSVTHMKVYDHVQNEHGRKKF